MSSAMAPNMETPPLAPQYHESVKERSFWGAACAAARAGSRAAQASPAVNVRIDRIAQPQMTRVEVSARRWRGVPGITYARTMRSAPTREFMSETRTASLASRVDRCDVRYTRIVRNAASLHCNEPHVIPSEARDRSRPERGSCPLPG